MIMFLESNTKKSINSKHAELGAQKERSKATAALLLPSSPPFSLSPFLHQHSTFLHVTLHPSLFLGFPQLQF
ncbi:hypothetical protein L2E82_09902 [Cichorium intybus]|uniref:Uncharacterized protein n=1 Tax=Cichorium intybus TaxID=13427 RepID=A0ACB9GBD2_CICIN|nr:hypothetical protein L2E82_09902 [Cichorium intybus]